MSGQEIVAPVNAIAAVDKMDVNEYEKWLNSEGVGVVEFQGSDWDIVGNKDTLVGKSFVIANIRFNEGDMGEFASVCAYTVPEGEKIVFNDGSTGVCQQLKDYVAKHDRTTGISCPKGLRVSRYTYTDPKDGKEKAAQTYYLA